MRTKMAAIAFGGLALLVASACTEPAVPARSPPPKASARPASESGPTFRVDHFVTHESVVHGFSMPLPDDPGWKIEDKKDGFFIATHSAAQTEIAARMLATDGLSNRARCDKRARDLRPLPDITQATIVDEERIDLPSGFDTVLKVGLLPTSPNEPITGFILAIGGWAKKCFVYALTTSATGRGAEQVVGDRLALFVERSLLRMRFSNDLKPNVPRERPPLGQ